MYLVQKLISLTIQNPKLAYRPWIFKNTYLKDSKSCARLSQVKQIRRRYRLSRHAPMAIKLHNLKHFMRYKREIALITRLFQKP